MAESVGAVYGSALSQLSFEAQSENQVFLQVMKLEEILNQNPDLSKLLSAPVLPSGQKVQLVADIFENQVTPLVLNFLKVLAEENRFAYFGEIAREIKEQYYQKSGIKEVLVHTAKQLNEQQLEKLRQTIEQKLNAKVLISQQVDETLYGGLCVEFDGKRIDGSLAQRLRQIEHTIKEGV